MEEYTIDVKEKSLGRAASEAATALRGKHRASYTPNRLPNLRVRVINLAQLHLSARKKKLKLYQRYSGHPGGRKETTLARAWDKKPKWVFAHAVRGMLPNNRLRDRALKRLVCEL